VLHFLSQHLWLLAAGGGVGVAGRYLQLRIRHTHKLILPDPTVDLLRLYQLHGYNAHALVGITPGIRLWTCPDGAVAYIEFGKVWLVPGDPLASVEQLATVSNSFLKKARAEAETTAVSCELLRRRTLQWSRPPRGQDWFGSVF